ncbi:MAG TPA: peptide chain release factor N(5)-glutamine methyltransferase [Xanthobacteraceae bacterium]|jgi:release factor glutamine methyltransferase|nr:peptide chain release factor N(5)-glutamine methyltransferase [Xanthobacteraceae bacterium]
MTMTATRDAQPSIATVRRSLAQSFRRHGLSTPELDARLLVAHALGLDHAGLAAQATRALDAGEADAIAALAARRLAREPVARIIGVKEFWGLDFKLNAATLVPRPETESVVEAALEARDRTQARNAALEVADLGTGTGALLLALLSELPMARGVGTDLSRDALGCARDNAVALGLAERASFVACDFGAALKGPFDIVVSNPPYVARQEIATLAPEVRVFDPRLALDGGPDGLAAYRAIAAGARRLLSPDSILVLELGVGQLDAVEHLFAAAGLVAIGEPRHDLLGIARALAVKLLP